ncbi:type I-E CRISPR-associated protein Cas5/CasD [Streptomyces sp. SPB074]|uniref:type I-E CRISPR-associated protein Cas5/CasD n=1 Tax=Streptomyces sp. (strain SPB074) TaxID=465543 RepID=UPI00017F0E41|nr:type I-E CRISPR-associated protein Cas5/CasD [Streptomyces sp. SPB074]EDY43247.1 CRISPR-associated protein [Streptomyces sp. SPB074]
MTSPNTLTSGDAAQDAATPDAPAQPTGPTLLMHLAGPLQSWGERSRFPSQRDTGVTPTRSALIGLFAAALGRGRDDALTGPNPDTDGDLRTLSFLVRTDRPGTRLRDFHTVGGGLPRTKTVVTAEGTYRKGANALVTTRHYLQDAAFTVAVTATDTALLERCDEALRRPRWPLYLGRRSCPPTGRVRLGLLPGPPMPYLLDLPLARPVPGRHVETVPVGFDADRPLQPMLPQDKLTTSEFSTSEVADEPQSYATLDRRYLDRTRHHVVVHLPAARCGGQGATYLGNAARYLTTTRGAAS